MIAKIKGKLSELEGNIALIETSSGIFYQVYVTPTIIKSSKLNQVIEIYTYLQVREDAHNLYGFLTKEEHRLFKLLLTVSGVGPKTAFAIISAIKINELYAAVKENDIEFFTSIPGLGKKTSMKVLLELSQKLDEDFKIEKMYMSDEDKTVVDALVSLGFKSHEAKSSLHKIVKNLSVEEKIRSAIQLLTKK